MSAYSVVIPTLNEGAYLPHLLNSIKSQSKIPDKIIIADCSSTDNTKEVALSFGCDVVPGGIPSVGRNNGFKSVDTPVTIFLDADSILPEGDFLEKCLVEFEFRKLDFASCFAKNLRTNGINGTLSIYASNIRRLLDQIFYSLFGFTLGASGWFLIVKSDVFKSLGGFNASLDCFEDLDFYRRALKKSYKFGTLLKFAYLSGRRYDKHTAIDLIRLGYFLLLYKLGFKEDIKEFKRLKGNLGGN